MAFTSDDLMTALRDCFDPHFKCNVVDLGFIVDASVTEDVDAPGAGIAGVPPRYLARVTMTPASSDEAYTGQLTAVIANRLAGLPEVSRSEIEVVFDALWMPERITPEGRRILELDRPPRNQGLVKIKIP